MEKAYKIRHIPTGKYLSKYVRNNKWVLGLKGKTWSVKLHSIIEGGVVIDDKLIPETEFEFVELRMTEIPNSLLNLSNHQIQDILKDMDMLEEDGIYPYYAEEIFRAGIEYVIKKLNQ